MIVLARVQRERAKHYELCVGGIMEGNLRQRQTKLTEFMAEKELARKRENMARARAIRMKKLQAQKEQSKKVSLIDQVAGLFRGKPDVKENGK